MKKIILMASFVLSIVAVNAQLSWTVRAGANVSGIENSDSQMKIGWKIGAGMDYSFSKLFSLRPMLYYTTKGCTYGKSTMGFSPDQTLKLNYLEMPILGSFHFSLGQNTSLTANAGPYLGYRISRTPSHTELKYNNFDMGANAGLDFIIKKIVIGAEAQYGFVNLAKTNTRDLHNINYSLTLGYKF